ncbi:MAG: hypothetical protein AAGA75_24415 [Cyanobacteria bacterium P01_E01_bin.6]
MKKKKNNQIWLLIVVSFIALVVGIFSWQTHFVESDMSRKNREGLERIQEATREYERLKEERELREQQESSGE